VAFWKKLLRLTIYHSNDHVLLVQMVFVIFVKWVSFPRKYFFSLNQLDSVWRGAVGWLLGLFQNRGHSGSVFSICCWLKCTPSQYTTPTKTSRDTTSRFSLSRVVAWIKGSSLHCQIGLLLVHCWLPYFHGHARCVESSINPAVQQLRGCSQIEHHWMCIMMGGGRLPPVIRSDSRLPINPILTY